MPVVVSYKVALTYFKDTGKFYADGKYTSNLEDLGDIWDEVRALRSSGNLPGLMSGSGDGFIIEVSVPEHPHAHPRLIV